MRDTKRILGAHATEVSVVQHDDILYLTPFLSFSFPHPLPFIFSLPLPLTTSLSSPSIPSPVTQDYGALPTTILTFDSSTTQYTVPVTIVNDDRAEPTETFTGSLNLISPVSNRITVSPDQTTVSIEDNDREE